MKLRASELSDKFKLELKGPDNLIEHLGLCNRTNLYPNTLSYVTSREYLEEALNNPDVSALICNFEDSVSVDHGNKSILISEYPEDIFYSIFTALYSENNNKIKKASPQIGINCQIHKSAIIEDGVVIGDNVTIGAFTIIHSNTTIGDNTVIGSHCAVGSNGFQALKDHNGSSYNVNHIGGVMIGCNCYIGEFVNISRGLFDTDVIIEDNVLIDVGCQVAHDCYIGKNSVLTGYTKMFGSSKIENDVWMSPGSMVMNRKCVASNCRVAPGAFIMTNTQAGQTYIGNPAIKNSTYIKRELKLKKLLK